MPTIAQLRQMRPRLADLTDDEVVDLVASDYPTVPRDKIARDLGVTPTKPSTTERTWGEVAKDVGISALKGAIAVPEAAVGIADMVSGGRAGQAAQGLGFRPREAKAILDEQYSDQQKEAFREVEQADGFVDTLKAAVSNPSVVGHSVVESLPSMAAGGLLARGALAVGARGVAAGVAGPALPGALTRAAGQAAPIVAGAMGEGAVMAGSAAEQIRQQTDDGLLTGGQSLAALATGAGGAGLALLGGKVAKKLGIADIDTAIAAGRMNATAGKGLVRRVLEGALAEGGLEELPQSVLEQVLENAALDRPLDTNVDHAAVLGLLSGAAMGGAANIPGGTEKPAAGPLARASGGGEGNTTPAAPDATTAAAALKEATTALVNDEKANRPDPDKVLDKMHRQAERDMQSLKEHAQTAPTAVEPGDVLRPSGEPFKNRQAAVKAGAGKKGGVYAVEGGFIFRPLADAAAPAVDDDPFTAPIKTPEAAAIDEAAHQAATSPRNDLPEPTQAQKEAGNYAKGKVKWQGLEISIENPQGSERSGTDPNGKPWTHTMSDHYGYIRRTVGADDEQVDVYLGPQPDAPQVFVVDQIKQDTGEFDEAKVMAGFPDQASAIKAYRSNFDAGWDVGPVTPMPVEQFKEWLKTGDLKQPVARVKPAPEVRPDAPAPTIPGAARKPEPGSGLVPEAAPVLESAAAVPAAQAPAAIPTWDDMKPGQQVTLYRGESTDNDQDGQWWTTDRAKAERYGAVQEVTLPAEVIGQHAARGHNGADEFVFVSKRPQELAVKAPPKGAKDEGQNPAPLAQPAGGPAAANDGADVPQPSGKLPSNDGVASGDAEAPPQGASQGSIAQPVGEGAAGKPAVDRPADKKARRAAVRAAWDGAEPKQRREHLTAAGYTDNDQARVYSGTAWNDLPDEAKAALQKTMQPVAPPAAPQQNAAPSNSIVAAPSKGEGSQQASATPPTAPSAQAPSADDTSSGKADDPRPAGKPAEAAPNKRETKAQREQREAEDARAKYFTPGNVVRSYSGFDEVLEYRAPKEPGGTWSVLVHEVREVAPHQWARVGRPQDARTHSTQPEARELRNGPRAQLPALPAADVPYTERRADGKPHPNAVPRNNPRQATAASAPAASAPPPSKTGPELLAEKMRADAEKKRAARAAGEAAYQANGDRRPPDDMQSEAERRAWIEGYDQAAPTPADPVVAYEGKGGRVLNEETLQRRNLAGVKLADDSAALLGENANLFQQALERDAKASFNAQGWFIGKPYRFVPSAANGGIRMFDSLEDAKRFADTFNQRTTPPAPPRKRLGKGERGQTIFENEAGVRSYTESGFKYEEDPGKPRNSTFKTLEELQAEKPAPSADTLRAQADLNNALADLGDLLGKPFRANIAPEQESKLVPILTRVLDAAFRLGFHKFKDAARFSLQKIREALGAEVADALTLEHLQGAYIAMSGGKAGADGIMDVAKFTSKAAIEDSTSDEAAPAGAPLDQNGGKPEVNDDRAGTDEKGPIALDPLVASEDGGTESGGDVSGGDAGRGQAGGGANPATDGGRVPGARGGRSGAGGKRAAQAGGRGGKPRVGTQGTRGDGAAIPGSDEGAESGGLSAGNIPATNYRITADTRLGQGGEVEKFNDNLAAIRALKAIESEQRRATPQEQRILARYVGWGGLKNAFPDPVTKEFKKGWETRGAELQELLSPQEHRAASRSTLDAHYTSEVVVSAMWNAARRLGFRGGLVLENSVGSGNFIGLKPAELDGARFVGVEYDSITARITALLYPQETVLHSGLQKVPLPDNTFALNIGNPPFGSQSLNFQFKPELRGVSIHNQFFRASMDALRPGGLQVAVVSRFLMDAQDSATRVALARQAKLVAAIRLPDVAFKENARTEVVTDILVFQKLTAAEAEEMADAFDAANELRTTKGDGFHKGQLQARADRIPAWVHTEAVKDPLGGEPITVNAYFARNRKQILGVLERSGSMQHGADVTVRLDNKDDLPGLLAEAVNRLPENIHDLGQEVLDATAQRFKDLSDSLRIALAKEEPGHLSYDADGKLQRVLERETAEGNYEFSRQEVTAASPWSEQLFIDAQGRWYRLEVQTDADGNPVKVVKNGKATKRNVYQRSEYATEADVPTSLRLGAESFERLKKLVRIRDLLKRQLVLETEDRPAAVLESNRGKLREAYEEFVAAHGPVNRASNATLVRAMPDAGLVLATEVKYESPVSPEQSKKTGLDARPEKAVPAPILSQRVVPKYEAATKAESPSDALVITLSERGRVDMPRIAELLGKTEAETIEALQAGKPLVFQDPESGQWETADAYLSGQVRRKLEAAKQAGLTLNEKALEAVQPEPWGPDKVHATMGSTWVPAQVYADFYAHMTGGSARVSYSRATNTFNVSVQDHGPRASDWGSPRASADYILGRLMNSQSVVVMTPGTRDNPPRVDQEMTALAQLKAKEMVNEFGDWVFAAGERRQQLTEIFNDKFNTRVVRQHDGSHLTLPGKVPDSIISMRRHQLNAIWRGIAERFMLVDHVVGAGKTYTAVARAMERRRMGLSRKPMIVVPNHLIEQWAADVYRLYPGAKVLAATQKDFESKRRRRLFGRIATGDWDIVLVPHSSFAFVGIAPETEERFLQEELRIALEAVEEAEKQAIEDGTAGGRRKPFGVKEAERLVEKIQTRLDKLGARTRDRQLTFEQLGVDDLTVDEAHEFKNLFYSSRMSGVRGMGDKTGSNKSFDLYNKVRVLRDSPTGTVTFMTGTPISNSAVEMFTMLRYLAADELRELGLEHFDAWRSQYVEATQKFEPTEAGGLKEVTRLGRTWSNMRSLMDLYYSVTDAVSIEDIQKWYMEDKGKRFPVPEVKGGERQLVAMKPTPAQQAMLTEVIAGFDGLDGIEDIYERNKMRLRLMNVARAISLDVRSIGPSKLADAGISTAHLSSPEKGGKLEKMAAEVKRIYDQWTPQRGTQLVFLDRSVPKAKGDDKIIREYDALVGRRDKALADGDEDAYRQANEELERFDANEIDALRGAQSGGWNAYQQMKDNLVALGIPANEIRFIQEAQNDAQKKAIFDAVNGGRIRVLIGSTPRMGAGTNVQERLVALHHGDVTWKPSDIEQREGRIIRQLNRFASPDHPEFAADFIPDFQVEILAYATERTVDAKMWDLNATKLRMINGIRKYDGAFSMEFEDEDSVSMAEMAALASGNPLLLERVTLESQLATLELLERGHRRSMYSLDDAIQSAERALAEGPGEIERTLAKAAALKPALHALDASARARKVTIEGKDYNTQFAANAGALEAIKAQQNGNDKGRYSVSVDGADFTSKDTIAEAIANRLGDVEPFEATIGSEVYIRRTGAAKAIADAMTEARGRQQARVDLGEMLGMQLVASVSYRGQHHDVDLKLVDERGVTQAVGYGSAVEAGIQFTPASMRSRLEKLMESAANAAAQTGDYYKQRMQEAERDLPDLRRRRAKPFPKADEVQEKKERLREVVQQLSTGVVADPTDKLNKRQTGHPVGNTTDVVFRQDATDLHPADGKRVVELQQSMDGIRQAIGPRSPTVTVVASVTAQAVPAPVRAEARALIARGGEIPSGVFYNGEVWLFADRIANEQEAAETVFHEVLGHMGLRGAFGDRLDGILRQIASARPAEVAAIIRRNGFKASERLRAAEELLAEMAQKTPTLGFVRRAVAAIRTFLRAAGLSLRLTDDELIRSFILPARAFAQRGRAEPGSALAFDQTGKKAHGFNTREVQVDGKWRPIDTARGDLIHPKVQGQMEFWRRFGDRFPLDEQGRPQVEQQEVQRLLDGVGFKPMFNQSSGMSPKALGEAFKRMKEEAKDDLLNVLDQGMEAELSEDESRIVTYPGRDGFHSKGRDGGAYRVPLREFAAWLQSDAPLDPKKFDQDAEWREQIERLRSMLEPASDIRFNQSTGLNNPRDFMDRAKGMVDELAHSPGKLNWWQKTFGTPYDLAQRHPHTFGRVYNRVQEFLRDVSLYATEAADLAPQILPKLDTWRDALKSPLSAEDTKAVQAPIFEGTLAWRRDRASGRPVKVAELEERFKDVGVDEKASMLLEAQAVTEKELKRLQALNIDSYEGFINNRFEQEFLSAGIVWKDAELRDLFKLTPEQIGLYREARAAIDKSLTNLVLSDIVRYAGKHGKPIADLVMETGDMLKGGEMLRDYLLSIDEQDMANTVISKANRGIQLAEKGYAPLSRFGTHTVDVVDTDGERVYFGLYESRWEAKRAAARLSEQFPGARIRRGTTSQESYSLFAGVTPETVELFGEMLGLESDGKGASNEAFQKFLKEARSSRSAMKRLIERKGIAGFSEDVGRVLAGFVYSNARQTSSNLHSKDIADDVTNIPQGEGELKDAAVRLMRYVTEPQEEAVALRSVLFAQYLGGSIAAMMVNMTQPFAVTAPYLTQWAKPARVGALMAGATSDVWKEATGDAALDKALKLAAERGIVAPQEVHQLMKQAQGKASLISSDGTVLGKAKALAGNTFSKAALLWGQPFAVAELFNRRLTFIAAYRLAVEQGMHDPAGFAEKAINDTQFVYNKGNKPRWARGAVGSVLFTFKQYSISYLELTHRMWTQGGPEGKKAAVLMLVMLMLMGGAGGLPFIEDVSDLIDGIGQRLGFNIRTKHARQEFLRKHLGEALGGFIDKGVTGLPGMPIDVAARFGMGNLIPGTGLFTKKKDHTRDVVEVLGPAGDLARRVFDGAGMVLDGKPVTGALEASPAAARNLQKAYLMATHGYYPDSRGKKVIDTTGFEAFVKALGFQPHSVARMQEASRDVMQLKEVVQMKESEIADRWARAMFEKDQAAAKSAQDELRRWNENNPTSRIVIKRSQLTRRVREMNRSKAERLASSSPKEIREQVKQELARGDR